MCVGGCMGSGALGRCQSSHWELQRELTLNLQGRRSYSKRHNYCIQYSPCWEADRFSASQEIPKILCNPKVHYRIHKCQISVPILKQINPVHKHISHFMMIHHNIILLSAPGFPKWPLSLTFPHYTPVYPSPLPINATCHDRVSSILTHKKYWGSSTGH